ncbi:J domain-containing protein [Bosea sp. (in: a-proteobacteria)]|uniref:J domain-containing protein n=1 Tax=Bosea sp. (in: a-proteobacteria) TaxID=1871050 RepID=UPI001ACA33DC|nr:J domain-containing protein [Bosea sp. (in: a-proteobacteria)]MBN9441141.1 J domain-containing protein [Bosea sp. (in: a-proteobacteria)]
MISAYPLSWPPGFPRAKSRESGRFKTSLSTALKNVEGSLRLFGADSHKPVSGIVLSSNVTLGRSRPEDPGVAAWFTWDGEQICIPVDRYATVEANLQAIHHVVEARRVELRHGTLALVRATMQGFRALPAPPGKSWREVLEIHFGSVTRHDIEASHRKLSKVRHPDVSGGSAELMIELNVARDQALKEVG